MLTSTKIVSKLVIATVCTLSAYAHAAQNLNGSQCGLSNNYGGDDDASEWQFNDKRRIALDGMQAYELEALPKLVQQQLIETINFTAGDHLNIIITDVLDAAQALIEGSEGEEAYVLYFSFKGQKYTTVIYYPGGNPVGLIFKAGSAVPFADNSDGSISCL